MWVDGPPVRLSAMSVDSMRQSPAAVPANLIQVVVGLSCSSAGQVDRVVMVTRPWIVVACESAVRILSMSCCAVAGGVARLEAPQVVGRTAVRAQDLVQVVTLVVHRSSLAERGLPSLSPRVVRATATREATVPTGTSRISAAFA